MSANKLPTKKVVDMFFNHMKPHLPSPHKPVLINIHGFLGSKTMFHSINKAIAGTVNTDIYTVDVRDHGDSPQAHPMTYSVFLDDMLHFIDSKIPKGRQIDFIGFSMGAKIAMMLALNKEMGHRVRRIVSVDMPPYATPILPVELNNNWALINQICSGQIRIKRGGIQWRNKIIDMLGLYFGSGFLQEECNYISRNNKLVKYYLPVAEFPNVVEDLKEWEIRGDMHPSNDKVEVLFQRGLRSCMVESNYDRLTKVFPNSVVEEFDTSHNLIFEDFDRSTKSMAKFINDGIVKN